MSCKLKALFAEGCDANSTVSPLHTNGFIPRSHLKVQFVSKSTTGSFLWRREWLPTPVFLPGKLDGQRNLVGYSPWNHKESDTTK